MQGVGPGSLLGGRYAVHQRLSQQPAWERWSAADNSLERDVVLLCFPRASQQADAALDAARRAAGVEESRLTRILDVGVDADLVFVVEEPMTGAVTLTNLLVEGGLPADEVRRIVGESASGLAAAATRGLHHGVLTPRDVLLLPDGSVKVRGLATQAALLGEDDRPSDQASRADALALAGVLYAGLTGRWPLPGPAPGLEAAPRLVSGVAAPSEIAAGVPVDIDLLVTSALSGEGGPATPSAVVEQLYPGSTGPGRVGLVPGSVAAVRVATLRTNPLPRDPATGGVATGTAAQSGGSWPGRSGATGRSGARGRGAAAKEPRPSARGGDAVRGGGRLWGRGGAGAQPSASPDANGDRPADGAAGAAGTGRADAPESFGATPGSTPGGPSAAGPAASATSGAPAGRSDADDAAPAGGSRPPGGGGLAARPRSARLGTSRLAWRPGPSAAGSVEPGADDGGASGASGGLLPPGVVTATAAAGSAVAGATGTAAKTVGKGVRSVAGAVGATAATVAGQVGRAARTTTDRAAERSASKAERRRYESMPDDLFETEEATLTEVLVETDEELEPSVPARLAPDAPSAVGRPESKLALAIVAGFVVLAAVIGIWGLPQLGALPTSSTPSSPNRSVSAAPSSAAEGGAAAAAGAQLTPVAIVGSAGFEPTNGGQVPSNSSSRAHDGNLDSGWTSKWFTTEKFGGLPMQGIGLVVDLGQPTDVRQVKLNLPVEQEGTVYVASQASLDGAKAVGTFAGQKGEVVLDTPSGAAMTGELVIVFVTRLGPDGEGKFRAQVSEIQVSK